MKLAEQFQFNPLLLFFFGAILIPQESLKLICN